MNLGSCWTGNTISSTPTITTTGYNSYYMQALAQQMVPKSYVDQTPPLVSEFEWLRNRVKEILWYA